MQYSTRPALAALLMATGVLSKPCGKHNHKHVSASLSIPSVAATISILPLSLSLSEPSTTVAQPTSTLITSVVAATPSTSAIETTIAPSSSSSSVLVITPSTTATPSSSSSSSAAAAASTTAASNSSTLTTDQQAALDSQNSVRSDLSESALVWDETLVADALTWAQNLASAGGSAGTLTHATGTGEGENLYWQSTSDNPYANAATAWVGEKSLYNGEAITGTGNFEEYGHYTQIVWESTTKVGMAIASDGSGGYYVVARYTPEGNVIGETPTSSS